MSLSSNAYMSGPRTDYTKNDDSLLSQYLAKYSPTPEGRLGNALYKKLVMDEDNLWPFSKRHSWQSWRERYKKHKDEFDARIRRLQRGKNAETPNADTSANVQPPLDSQSKVERPESRKSARKLPVEEPVLRENIDIGTSTEIIPDYSETQENGSSPAKTNEVQGGDERQSNGKRKGEEPQGTGGRERKRMKGKERGVVFEDELENTKRATSSQSTQFETVVNYLLDKFKPEELNYVQDLIRKRTESPSLSAAATPTKAEPAVTNIADAERLISAVVRQNGRAGGDTVKAITAEREQHVVDGVEDSRNAHEYRREYPDLSEFEMDGAMEDAPARMSSALPGSFPIRDGSEAKEKLPLFLKAVSEVPESNDEDIDMEHSEAGNFAPGRNRTRDSVISERIVTDEEVDELDEDSEFEEQGPRDVASPSPPVFSDIDEPTPAQSEVSPINGRAATSRRLPSSEEPDEDDDKDDYFASPTDTPVHIVHRTQPDTATSSYGTSARGFSSNPKQGPKDTNGFPPNRRKTGEERQALGNRHADVQLEGKQTQTFGGINGRRPLTKHVHARRREQAADGDDSESELDGLGNTPESMAKREREYGSVKGGEDSNWPIRKRLRVRTGVSTNVDQIMAGEGDDASLSADRSEEQLPKAPKVPDRVDDEEYRMDANAVEPAAPQASKSTAVVSSAHSMFAGPSTVRERSPIPVPRLDTQHVGARVNNTDISMIDPTPLSRSSQRAADMGSADIGMLTERSDFSHRAHRHSLDGFGVIGEDDMRVEIAQPLFHVPGQQKEWVVPSRVPGSSHSANTDVFYAPAARRNSGDSKGKQKEHNNQTESSPAGGNEDKYAHATLKERAIRRRTFGGFKRNDGLLRVDAGHRQARERLRNSESFRDRRGSLAFRLADETPSESSMGIAELFWTPRERERENLNRRVSLASTIDLDDMFKLPEGHISETDKTLINRAGLTMFLKRMSENHGFREEVVWNVYNSTRDLVETDGLLREMRESAEKTAMRLMVGGANVGTGADDHEHEHDLGGGGITDKDGDQNVDFQPDMKRKAVTSVDVVSHRESTRRSLAPSPHKLSLTRTNLTFTPVRDDALLRRVRRDHQRPSPPSMTRADTFIRLAEEGRLDEALARERRRTSHGGALQPLRLSEKIDGHVTSIELSSVKSNQKNQKDNKTRSDTLDPFQDSKNRVDIPAQPSMQFHFRNIKQESHSIHLGEISLEKKRHTGNDDVWTEEDDLIILRGGDVEGLEFRKGKGSVKARIAQLMASGKFL